MKNLRNRLLDIAKGVFGKKLGFEGLRERFEYVMFTEYRITFLK